MPLPSPFNPGSLQSGLSITMSFSQTLNGGPPSSQIEKSIVPPVVEVKYRLYKRRFSGLFGFIILGIVSAMPGTWFGPITNIAATDFHISVNQVNWLGNIILCIFLPISILIPVICSRYGIRRCTEVGGVILVISAWVRYAGTIRSLSPQSAYALLILGQLFSGIAQPVFQVLGPMYSERWFNLNGRTTATMLIAIANPIGAAISQLLSPLGTTRQLLLVLGIISTVAGPAVLLISDSPPLPPTYSGSKSPLPPSSLCRAVLGLPVPQEAYMTPRERIDFLIITLVFGAFVGGATAASVLSAEWFQPAGYPPVTVGLFGATSILAGIISAVISAPLLDRVFTHNTLVTLKILVPTLSLAWLSLIWAVRPNNTAVLFVIVVIIGMCNMTLLPVVLEHGVELTRNADGSASILWCSGNIFGIMLILVEGELRAPSTANPPYHMHGALILQGCVAMVFGALVFVLRARQVRREMDETMMRNDNTVLGTAAVRV